MSTPIEPLRYNVPIVRKDGTPDPAFHRQLNDFIRTAVDTEVKVQLAKRDAKDAHDAADAAQATADAAVPQTRLINTTSPLAGGGDLTADRTISHVVSGVTAGVYGDATHTLTLTVDATGHITAISLNAVSGGGAGTVTTTGSPASGNLAKFSGATSIVNGDLSGDVTTSGALVTTLAASGVTAATYGDSTHVGQFTVDAKGRITSASNVAISGGGGGGAWTLNSSWTWSTNVTEVDFTGLAGVSEILVFADGVSLGTSGVPLLQVSTNNGSTYYSASGDYKAIAASGTSVSTTGASFANVNATAAKWGTVRVIAPNLTGAARMLMCFPSDSTPLRLFTADNSNDIDAIRVVGSAGGNLTAGSIWVYTR